MRDASPLRYPGGKWRIATFFERIICLNRLIKCHYVEPYAGGASLGLSLLFGGHVSEVHLNDLDPAIYSFWYSVLNYQSEFLDLLARTSINPEERQVQKQIYAQGQRAGALALGFATFFLNRTNHSGILNGGMIGGRHQSGVWKLDVRFNVSELRRRIERIGTYGSRIHIYNEDAIEFLRRNRFPKTALKYLDPPYYASGTRLYLNSYTQRDHSALSQYVRGLRSHWIVSYDDVDQTRELYRQIRTRRLNLLHSARDLKVGREVLFFSPSLRIPRYID